MIFIGLSGKKRVGKNTVASQLKLLTNQTIDEFAFAYPLKVEAAKMLGVNVADIETNKDLYRPMLQAYGEYCRNRKGKDKSGVEYGKDYWCIVTFREIVKSSADIVIITDVRYPEDCEWIKRSGGIVVRICRETGLKDEHVSETSLDTYNNFDHIILNTGDLGHLFQDVKDLVVKLKIKIK